MNVFKCLQCSQQLQVKDDLSGKKVKCPKCGEIIQVPLPSLTVSHRSKSDLPDKENTSEQETIDPSLPGGPASQEGTISLQSKDTSADKGLYDFLAPPQGQDELGRLGPYRVLKVLGEGGMGVVFLAEDPHLDRKVALKAMKPALAASNSSKKRFLREAKTTASIKHDNIVNIYQVGEDRGVPFLAMEYLEGESLDDCIKRESTLPLAEILRIGREIAEGLAQAHEKGLIHRDIKPANIWLEGKRRRVKILDFGLARTTDDDSHLTQSGAIIGTPAYMAPEQGRCEQVDHRCDLFSLGCVLYRLCTGHMPFKGNDTISTLMAVAMEMPKPPNELNRDVPLALSKLVMKLLAKDKTERPATAQVVTAQLREIEGTQTTTNTTNVKLPNQRPHSSLRKNQKWVLACTVAITVMALSIYFLSFLNRAADSALNPNSSVAKDETVRIPPLDRLTMGNIPKEELFPWQPPELVAVIGEHRQDAPIKYSLGAFAPDGTTLALIKGNNVSLVDLATLKERATLTGHTRPITCVAYSPDGKTVASGSHDRTVFLWDVANGTKRYQLKGHTNSISAVTFTPDSKRLVSATGIYFEVGQDQLKCWDSADGQNLWEVNGGGRGALYLAVSPNGNSLAVARAGGAGVFGNIGLYDLDGKHLGDIFTLRRGFRAIIFSPDGEDLVTSGNDSASGKPELLAWFARKDNPPGGSPRMGFQGIPAVVNNASFTPDGTYLASAHQDGSLILWDYITGKRHKEWKLPDSIQMVLFAPDGKHLAVGNADGTVYILRLDFKH